MACEKNYEEFVKAFKTYSLVDVAPTLWTTSLEIVAIVLDYSLLSCISLHFYKNGFFSSSFT